MGPRAGLDGCGKSRPPPEFDPLDRPASSESLYRLSYPGPSYSFRYLHKFQAWNTTVTVIHDFRLPQRCKWDLCSSEIGRLVAADVSWTA